MEAKDFIIIILIVAVVGVFLYKEQQNQRITKESVILIEDKEEELKKNNEENNKIITQNKLYISSIGKQKELINKNNKDFEKGLQEKEDIINSLNIKTEFLIDRIIALEESPTKEITIEEKRKNLVEQMKVEIKNRKEEKVEKAMKQKQDIIDHQRKLEFESIRKPDIVYRRR